MRPLLWLLPPLLVPGSIMAQAPLRLVPFHRVRMDDSVWRPRIRALVHDTLPHAFENTREAQERLRLCGEFLANGGGPKPTPHRYDSSDLFKVMEGAALLIQSEPQPEIEALLDRLVDVIARAQQPDGYLYVPHTTGSIRVEEMGPRPYSFLLHSHELYNVGHLYEAAVAYAQATGKTALLDVALRNARHVRRAIFEGDPAYNDGKPVLQAPGHQEIELGLIKLFHQTGERVFLEMAKRFLDIRGVTFVPSGEGVNAPTYAQQHLPVREQREAVGHAVRATYMYAAMAEVESLLGTRDFDAALTAIWHDVVDRRMHLTGGLGAVHGIEGFGPPFELPNEDAYLETCAAVGNVFWNVRMFLKLGDARYLDVAEIALLNHALAGCGLDGRSFFYPNPLEARLGHRPRSAWFGTACCPSNIARLIPQVSGYQYATRGDEVFACLYGASRAELALDGKPIAVRQETDYPWDGDVTFTFELEQPLEFAFHLRIPTWAGVQLVPGALYRYGEPSPPWSIGLGGAPHTAPVAHGFATLRRTWRTGDRVTLRLPLPVHTNHCRAEVEANRGRTAFSRGPLVYCAEGIDNGGAVQRFFVDDPASAVAQARVATIADGPLTGLRRVTVPARELSLDGESPARALHLVPYFAWANRDRGSMITWLPTRHELAQPDRSDPSRWKFAGVSASHTFANDFVDAIRMPHTPRSSRDGSVPRWTSWPQRGREQWVEIDLGAERTVHSVSLYFYDDGGGVQVPGSWNVAVQDGDAWLPVAIDQTDSYGTRKDAFNTVHPATTLRTRRLRLELRPRHGDACVGLLAVDVDTQ